MKMISMIIQYNIMKSFQIMMINWKQLMNIHLHYYNNNNYVDIIKFHYSS